MNFRKLQFGVILQYLNFITMKFLELGNIFYQSMILVLFYKAYWRKI